MLGAIWKREEEEARSAYFEFGLPGYPDTRWKVGEVVPIGEVLLGTKGRRNDPFHEAGHHVACPQWPCVTLEYDH